LGRDLVDFLSRGAKEEPQASDKVYAAVEEETALVAGNFAPCSFAT
jgi:hypothetical protein